MARIELDLVNRQRGYRVDRRRLLAVARQTLRAEGVQRGEIDIAIVDDKQITRLNGRTLGHRGPTDVLSFDLSDGQVACDSPQPIGLVNDHANRAVVGQIVVSADTARRQARRFGHPIASELALYVIHGLLHLLGYDDRAEPARSQMHRRQRELADRLGLKIRG